MINEYATTKKVTITFSDQLLIYKFLQEDTVMRMVGDKLCAYVGNWNDRTVAEHFTIVLQKRVSHHNVAGLRAREFGLLAAPTVGPSSNGELMRLINELTARVDKLEREHGLINHNG